MLREQSSQVDARLTVADCNRLAGLDFSCSDAAEAANALHKARVLRRVVSDFVDALEEAIVEAGPFEGGDQSPPLSRVL